MGINSGIFLAIIEAMAGNSRLTSEEKYSINEIVEKSNATEKEVFELLEAGIIKGTIVFGAPYIVGDTPYSVEKKLKNWNWKEGGNS